MFVLMNNKVVAALVCIGLLCHKLDARTTFTEYESFLRSQVSNKTFVDLFNKHIQLFKFTEDADLPAFPCETKPRLGPVTVHSLSPQDIGVVAAIGDSITAGLGIKATNILGLLREYRGVSWSIGGDGDVTEHVTIANIIKKYNPNVKGFSLNYGGYDSKDAHLNVADSGAVSSEMMDQANLLVERMRKEPGIDFLKDWKLITLFIGGNDLCDYCDEPLKYSSENYVSNIKKTLDILHQNVPRAFVNVVEVLNIADISVLNEGLICDAIHLFTCRCGTFPTKAEHDRMVEAVQAYQKGVKDLISTGRYDTKDDFAVVSQPFYEQTIIPRNADGSADLSYFSPDCFHLSAKGHRAAAEALWNNMIEPVGKKRLAWTPDEPVECPTDTHPYFYTNTNSDSNKVAMHAGNPNAKTISKDKNSPPGGSGLSTLVVIVCLAVSLVVIASVVITIRHRSAERTRLLVKHASTSYTEI